MKVTGFEWSGWIHGIPAIPMDCLWSFWITWILYKLSDIWEFSTVNKITFVYSLFFPSLDVSHWYRLGVWSSSEPSNIHVTLTEMVIKDVLVGMSHFLSNNFFPIDASKFPHFYRSKNIFPFRGVNLLWALYLLLLDKFTLHQIRM